MRHPLHSICPYFAMFPEDFVAKQLYAYTKRGDTVFDPFSGRGTTVFESLLNGRPAAGVDVNPVAVCISGAKADPPKLASVNRRLDLLEGIQEETDAFEVPRGDFFAACFQERTLQQVLFLRERLDWSHSRVDRFIAAVLLSCLHGESHKSRNCISNRNAADDQHESGLFRPLVDGEWVYSTRKKRVRGVETGRGVPVGTFLTEAARFGKVS